MNMSLKLGKKAGFNAGWAQGHFLGRCEAISRQINVEKKHWDIHILYVTSGMGIPYSPLDNAIIDSLKGLVRVVNSITPDQNVANHVALNRPDLVLVLNGMNFPLAQVDAIRAKGIRTAIWLADDPYYTDNTISMAPHYDCVFTLELNCVSLYQNLGCKNVYYLPFAADIHAFRPKHTEPSYRTEICFIGTAYWNRVAFFERVVPFLVTKNVHINGWWWDRLSNYSIIASKVALNDWMDPEKTASYYTGAKIVINMHRSIEDDSWNQNKIRLAALSPNPRTFEISASGAFQLTDIRQDLGRFYVPDKEIATYSSPEEMMEKINYFLEHEEERQQIAWNGLKRTLQEHTYIHRLSQLLSTIF